MQLWLKLVCTFCEVLDIFLVVGSNVCCAKIIRTHCCFSVVLSRKRQGCLVLLKATYVLQQYKRNALLRFHGNNGYPNRPQWYFSLNVGLRLILLLSAF